LADFPPPVPGDADVGGDRWRADVCETGRRDDGVEPRGGARGDAVEVEVVAVDGAVPDAGGVEAVGADGVGVAAEGVDAVGVDGGVADAEGVEAVGADGPVADPAGFEAAGVADADADAAGVEAAGVDGVGVASGCGGLAAHPPTARTAVMIR
jgi:hypothetical protein